VKLLLGVKENTLKSFNVSCVIEQNIFNLKSTLRYFWDNPRTFRISSNLGKGHSYLFFNGVRDFGTWHTTM
jgi:hypothetical protein